MAGFRLPMTMLNTANIQHISEMQACRDKYIFALSEISGKYNKFKPNTTYICQKLFIYRQIFCVS